MDQKELAGLIERELGRGGGERADAKPVESFAVDAAALDEYARETAALAEELRTAAKAEVGSITGSGFGRVGEDSGFAEALAGFAGALRAQVTGVADHAAGLGRATRRTADAYQREDVGIAGDFSKLLG
ncbi:type VII secretion target [Actinokineospora pegani]|uniref:type VII secretion target n=1 Tax=Actinokineospora pegani TaxID=2654637 RepID=UPI0012EA6FF0|nr:type VII secretion target [Actinokineospora pegani]